MAKEHFQLDGVHGVNNSYSSTGRIYHAAGIAIVKSLLDDSASFFDVGGQR